MFGKTLIKMVGLVMAGAIALAAGSQILASAIGIVLSFRYGDPVPMLLVAVSAAIILRTPQMFKDNGPFRTLQMVLAYAISAYLTLIVFIFLLPYGIIASLAGSSFAVVVCSLVHDPKEIQRFATGISLRDNARVLETFGRSSVANASPALELEAVTRMHVFLFPHGHEDRIVTIMRERPLLPISITRYEDFSVVVASGGTSANLLHQIKQMLRATEIDIDSRLSPLFLEAILKLPLIDLQFGLSMKEFCYVSHPDTVEYLLKNWVTRMTVFPTLHGPWVIVPKSSIPGLAAGNIPSGHEVDTLLLHDYSSIKETAEIGASAT